MQKLLSESRQNFLIYITSARKPELNPISYCWFIQMQNINSRKGKSYLYLAMIGRPTAFYAVCNNTKEKSEWLWNHAKRSFKVPHTVYQSLQSIYKWSNKQTVIRLDELNTDQVTISCA